MELTFLGLKMTVYKRNRQETSTQYIVTARELQVAVIRYVMNEKRVPKHWRYILVKDVVHCVSELVNNVIAACKTFPNTSEKLAERRHYLDSAMVCCYQLQNYFQLMISLKIGETSVDSLRNISGLLLSEIELLVKTAKNSKIIGMQKEV